MTLRGEWIGARWLASWVPLPSRPPLALRTTRSTCAPSRDIESVFVHPFAIMFAAHGWAVVLSSRDAYRKIEGEPHAVDRVDDEVDKADAEVHRQLRAFLGPKRAPDLWWNFRESMNNEVGLLKMASSRNHRGVAPAVLEVLDWLSTNAPGSYGVVYVFDDEDTGKRSGFDYSKSFRVWVLRDGTVKEHDDPFLSPRDDVEHWSGRADG